MNPRFVMLCCAFLRLSLHKVVMSRRSASSAMGTRLDAQLNVMCLHIVLFLVGMGSAAVAHPMGPTCFGFGGSGQSCTSALPGDTGKRRGSSLSSKTLAVKLLPKQQPCHRRYG
eukprot:2588614-Amphidinium_carterae.1